jgi:hypothetical protein
MKLTPRWLRELRELRKYPKVPFKTEDKDQLRQFANEASREMDRTLVTVCSAILAVSVPFSQQFVAGNPAAPWVVASWVFYALCLVVLIISLRYDSAQKHRLIYVNNHNDYVSGIYSVLIRLSNWLSQFLFLVATTLLVVFLIVTALVK